jgi:hypothetical protein
MTLTRPDALPYRIYYPSAAAKREARIGLGPAEDRRVARELRERCARPDPHPPVQAVEDWQIVEVIHARSRTGRAPARPVLERRRAARVPLAASDSNRGFAPLELAWFARGEAT